MRDSILFWYLGKQERGLNLSEVRIEDGESLESALKRFKKKVQKAGILTEVRRREHYEKPSVKKKRKSAQARKKKRF